MVDFQNLQIWQKAHELVLEIYEITASFPKDELYGLTTQMRRSASSIPTNIAEGSGRSSQADFNRFLVIALGSISELQYQLILSKDLRYINIDKYEKLSTQAKELRKMTFSYSKKLT